MIETKTWLEEWQKNRNKLVPLVNINSYFSCKDITGIPVKRIYPGSLTLATGDLVVGDPLHYLEKELYPFLQTAPRGSFPISVAVALPLSGGHCYSAIKLDFTGKVPVRFEEALTGIEDCSTFSQLEEGDFFGFNVKSGLSALCDRASRDAFCDFRNNWELSNPDKNFYTDFLEGLFYGNYCKNPEFQLPCGEWLLWNIPKSSGNILLLQSGFGEGCYPCYWGFDKEGELSSLFIQFTDIEFDCT